MGAWTYMEPRLRELTGDRAPMPIRYIGRPERASPAEGSLATHNSEQARIVAAAYADAPALKTAAGRGKQTNGSKQSANADAAVSMPQRATKRS